MRAKFRVRHALVLTAALLGGSALALPFASQASTPSASDTSSSTTTTTPTTTTATTTTTTTTTTTPPPPPSPPNAYGGGAEQVGVSSAVLKGSVDPRGQATTYYFQYGPTTAYGAQTSPVAIGAGTAAVKVVQPIAGLQPYTTYHFRVVASNAAGTAAGKDAAFKTKRAPLSLTAAVSPIPAVFGRPLRVSGTLSGTSSVGAEVVLQADPFPYEHGFHPLTSPEVVSATGGFSFSLAGLFDGAELRVATIGRPAVYSPVLTEPVAVGVTLHARRASRHGYVRLYGTVTPAQPGAQVAFERRVRGHYVTVSGTRVHAGSVSRFGRTVRVRRGAYRALVLVPTGRAQVSGRSRTVTVR